MKAIRSKVQGNSKRFAELVLYIYFRVLSLSLALAAAFPEKTPLKNELRSFLLYKVWPIVFILIWAPLVPMVSLKILQFQANRDWEALLDIMHMFFVGCFTLYVACVIQITSRNYKDTVDILHKNFFAYKTINFKDILVVLTLWIVLAICFLLYIGGCVYYHENLVPLWVPFLDNDKELPNYIFYLIWVYEGGAAVLIFFAFAVWGPFIIVASVCICKELNLLVKLIHDFKLIEINSPKKLPLSLIKEEKLKVNLNENSSFLEEDRLRKFLKWFVNHHLMTMSAVSNVSRVNSFIFLVQTVVIIVHSCFLAFNIYYTSNLEKVLVKSSPIMFCSYYIMFAYCWNGQQLTDKFEELYRAVYHCPWYNCPHTFKTSLLIMMEIYKRPVHLTGGGLFPATLETFLRCLQQSVSYILLLKELTPEKSGT